MHNRADELVRSYGTPFTGPMKFRHVRSRPPSSPKTYQDPRYQNT